LLQEDNGGNLSRRDVFWEEFVVLEYRKCSLALSKIFKVMTEYLADFCNNSTLVRLHCSLFCRCGLKHSRSTLDQFQKSLSPLVTQTHNDGKTGSRLRNPKVSLKQSIYI